MSQVELRPQHALSHKEEPNQFQVQGIEHLISEAKNQKKNHQPLVIIMTGIAGSGKTTGAILTSQILSNQESISPPLFTTADLPKTAFLTPHDLVNHGIISTDFFFVDRQSPLRKSKSLDDWWRKNDFFTVIQNICSAINNNESSTNLKELYSRTSGQLDFIAHPLSFPIKNFIVIEGSFAHRAIPLLKKHGINILHIRLKEDNQTILNRFIQRVRENPYRSLEAQYEHFYNQVKPQWEIIQKELINHPHDLNWTSLSQGNGVLIHKNYRV